MVSHSNFKSLFWSSVSEATYSDKENGMELRGCWPSLPPTPEDDCAVPEVDSLLREPDAAAAASFGFLEEASEPWLGAEPGPSMSKSVL